MSTIGVLLVYAVVVWAAFKMSKKSGSKKWISWAAFVMAFAAGFMLLGTDIPGWLQAIPGGFVAYIAAAAFGACVVTLGLDLPDGTANRPAISAALVGPLMFVLGWATLVDVVVFLFSGGTSAFTSAI